MNNELTKLLNTISIVRGVSINNTVIENGHEGSIVFQVLKGFDMLSFTERLRHYITLVLECSHMIYRNFYIDINDYGNYYDCYIRYELAEDVNSDICFSDMSLRSLKAKVNEYLECELEQLGVTTKVNINDEYVRLDISFENYNEDYSNFKLGIHDVVCGARFLVNEIAEYTINTDGDMVKIMYRAKLEDSLF